MRRWDVWRQTGEGSVGGREGGGECRGMEELGPFDVWNLRTLRDGLVALVLM